MAKDFDDMTEEELLRLRGDDVDAEDEEQEAAEEAAEEEGAEEDAEEAQEEAAEDEAEPGEEPAPKPKPKAKEPMLPKSRYDAKAKQVRELEARLKALEEAAKPAPQPPREDPRVKQREELGGKLEALDDQINDALLDGDKAKAKELRKQARDLERQLFKSELEETSEVTRARTLEEVKLDLLIDQVEERIPALNPKDDAYDPDLMNEVQALRADFLRAGHSPTQALVKAIRYTVPEASRRATEVPSDEDAGTAKRAERREAAVKKAVEASTKTPPKLKNVGEDSNKRGVSGKINPARLTEKDFSALPETTLKRLRGDYV